MGLERRLFISNRWNVEDVKDTIESLFAIEVKYESTHSPDYVRLNFTVDNDPRSMSVFTSSEHAGFKGVLLQLGASGESDRILRAIAERLGGFYNEQDNNDNWVSYPYVAGSNLEFLLKDAIKTGATDGRSSKAFREYLVKSEKEHKAWEKKNQEQFEKLIRGRK